MIYKHMYIGYNPQRNIAIKGDSSAYTATVKYYENYALLYFESKDASTNADDVAEGTLMPFPDGRKWFEMAEIFHYFAPETDDQWVRKIENKERKIRVNRLERDKIASYIYYHVEHQNDNQVDEDKFFSIFIYDNLIFIYSEVPEEYVQAALSPATVKSVTFDGERSCRVIVDADQLSLAIGKEGQNARLAARLTGYKIDIKTL